MSSILKLKVKVKFFFDKKIKVLLFLNNGFKHEGYISELLDDDQFGFNDELKGEDVFEYNNVSNVSKKY